ncbi:MAG: hypothetical protein LBF15_04540 [Candidatus Peribacteria bacterium]|jgi:PBP1b-binding outer membrane lipoprotein LpoB|nr:hypothetical protein [Candidatus Peribacteria bacterium]
MRKNLALILVTLFFLSSCSTEEQIVQEEVTPKYVVTQIVEEKPFTEMIKLPGKIVASKETSVSSLAS